MTIGSRLAVVTYVGRVRRRDGLPCYVYLRMLDDGSATWTEARYLDRVALMPPTWSYRM